MAYLDLSEPHLALAAAVPVRQQEASGFSPMEWAVIGLARYETRASLAAPGRFRRFVERLFDIRRPNPFASARLETLRRVAVLLRRGTAWLGADERTAFLASGFSPAQLDMLAQHLAGADR